MKETIDLPSWANGRVWEYHWQGMLHPLHRHDELEMNLVVQGSAAYLIDGQRSDLLRGSMVWLFPEQNHILLDQSREFAMWLIVARPAMVDRVATDKENSVLREPDPGDRFYRHLREEQTTRLEALLSEVAEIGEANPDRYNAGLAYALLTSWAAYQAADATGQGTRVHPAVGLAVRLMRDESEPLSLDELARQAGVSAPWLSHLFHRQVGMPVAVFRNKQRILRFLQRFEQDTHINMTEAAFDAGFGSYAQFYRVFKEQVGIAPAEYLRRSKGGAT